MNMRLPVLAAAVLLAACAGSRPAPKPSGPPPKIEVSAADADAAVKAGTAVLVDVREKKEVAAGMAAPAMWVPLSAARAEDGSALPALDHFTAGLPKDKTVIVYCHSGRRAEKFAALLKARGYSTLNMGGFASWKDAGLPVRTP